MALGMNHLGGVFLLLLVGLILSGVTSGIEYVVWNTERREKRRRRGSDQEAMWIEFKRALKHTVSGKATRDTPTSTRVRQEEASEEASST